MGLVNIADDMRTLADAAAALFVTTLSAYAVAAGPPPPPPPLAGWRDGPFLRDETGRYVLYVGGRIDIDCYDFAGSGVTSVPANGGGLGLKARLFMRRL